MRKIAQFFKDFCTKIWRIEKLAVSLHQQKETKLYGSHSIQ